MTAAAPAFILRTHHELCSVSGAGRGCRRPVKNAGTPGSARYAKVTRQGYILPTQLALETTLSKVHRIIGRIARDPRAQYAVVLAALLASGTNTGNAERAQSLAIIAGYVVWPKRPTP